MQEVCENSGKENEINFLNKNENSNESEEEQKKLKNIMSEFKKDKQDIKKIKKLNNSLTIKKISDLSIDNRNDIEKNEDGTYTETKIESYPDGGEKVIQTRYDASHNIISRKIYFKNNNLINNNNNNLNHNNNNNQINNNNQFNNNRGHIFKASNGYSIESRIEDLPNGRKVEKKIIRDDNDNIIDTQEKEIIYNNRNENYHINLPHLPHLQFRPDVNNYRRNNSFMPNNNMNNMRRNNFGNNNQMNPMMNMNMFNYRNYNRRNRFNMNNMNPMNNMPPNIPNMPNMPPNMPPNMNNIPPNMPPNMPNMNNMNNYPIPMMNNFGFPFMNMMFPMPFPFMPNINNNVNRVDPNILNSLPETEVNDASKLDPDNKNCVICLEDFVDKDHIICLPCIHVFHSDCIKSWLEKNNCCPTCKFELTYENINAHS